METKNKDFMIRLTAKDNCKILSYVYRGSEYEIDRAYGDNAMIRLNNSFVNFMFGWNMACICHGQEPVMHDYSLTTFLKQQAEKK